MPLPSPNVASYFLAVPTAHSRLSFLVFGGSVTTCVPAFLLLKLRYHVSFPVLSVLVSSCPFFKKRPN